VLIEDYLAHGYDSRSDYSAHEGAKFSDLFRRQRELPFGKKLQNHALNSRLNSEFKKYFPISPYEPIVRNLETNRYWINENLLRVQLNDRIVNIARAIIAVIQAYIDAKKIAFEQFLDEITQIQGADRLDAVEAQTFIMQLVRPNVDARIFEIVSYAILKSYYANTQIY